MDRLRDVCEDPRSSLQQAAPLANFLSGLTHFSDREPGRGEAFFARDRALADALYQDGSHLKPHGLRLFRGDYFPQRIGEVAKNLDLFIKSGRLGLREDFRGLLPWFRNYGYANPALIKYFSRFINISRDPRLLAYAARNPGEAYEICHCPTVNGRHTITDYAAHYIQTLWEQRDLPPILQLSDEHRDRGLDLLQDMGLPRDAWWVAVHARTDGYHGERGDARSIDIETYFGAMDEITKRGGWVFRLGDPSMPELPEAARVVDMAHSPLKSDWFDLFLVARARFCITCTSGMSVLPNLFGTPQLQTNLQPMFSRPYSRRDLFLPVLLRRKEGGALVPLAPLEGTLISVDGSACARAGVELVRNSREDIRRATLDMIAFVENGFECEVNGDASVLDAVSLMRYDLVSSRPCPSFLERYSDLVRETASIL
ncbi:MAG: TIGR04372 family glycosyltransferase [Hyphomicrobiales bacterium]|nr:TIGR04372 family glycosyltransferase [Hyphomicrobiales bacterium]MCP5370501.1 TIGR04372 family glycosyltransferase [Hyphomicrobiales bacterium]